MKYTKDRPTKPGWYWFRSGQTTPTSLMWWDRRIVYLARLPGSDELCCCATHDTFSVREMGGEFAGPIPRPEE